MTVDELVDDAKTRMDKSVEAMRHERYRFLPVRRVSIQTKREDAPAGTAELVGQTGRRGSAPAP